MRLERRSITSKVRADVNHDAVLRDSVCRSLQRPQPPHNSFPTLAPLCGPQQAVARRSLSDRTAYRREVAPTRSLVERGTTGNPPRDRCRSGPTEHAQRVSAARPRRTSPAPTSGRGASTGPPSWRPGGRRAGGIDPAPPPPAAPASPPSPYQQALDAITREAAQRIV